MCKISEPKATGAKTDADGHDGGNADKEQDYKCLKNSLLRCPCTNREIPEHWSRRNQFSFRHTERIQSRWCVCYYSPLCSAHPQSTHQSQV